MQNNFSTHKYWIMAGIAIAALIIILYPNAVYDSINIKVTRSQAIDLAKDFLTKENIKVNGFYEEAFFDNSPVETRYILKKLGGEKFKQYSAQNKWPFYGWNVMFHQNLPRQIQQTTINVYVANDGSVIGFDKKIPDTESFPSVSKREATAMISGYLKNKIGDGFGDYKLIESKEENFRNRTDFSFRWEKDEPGLNAKIVITANVMGNTIGSFHQYFEVPQSEREYFVAIEAIYGTVSAIFVVFLILLAFYLFLKKYHQGEVWMSLGRTLFILYFILSVVELINYWPAIGQGAMVGNVSFINTKIIVLLINGLILNFFLAVLLFASWTVGESYARGLWPNKLKGIDAFIKGHFYAIDSGTSLMRGFILGGALAPSYLVARLLLNKPNAKLFVSPTSFFDEYTTWLPSVSIILGGVMSASLASIAITFFVVNISYQRWKKKWISIFLAGVVTTLAYVIAATPPSINNFGLNILAWFIFGCGIAYIYFLFDLLTIISLHFHAILIAKAYAMYASTNQFFEFNFVVLIMALLISPIFYLMSRLKKEEFVLENYGIPSHIKRISERERLKKEMEIAAKVQLSLLPKEEPRIPGYEISSISIPAVEAGGDYFDFVKLSGNKIGIAIGDVSGKGVGAAIYMTLTKGILQAHAEEDASPRNVLGKVNRLLYKTIEKNSFVSMFYAILDVNNNSILYSRAGHNPGILCSNSDGSTKLLLSKGMALGLEEGSIFTSTLNEETIGLRNGDIFVLYTDGFTEAMNEKEELYGEERLINLIKSNSNLSARELINLVLKDVNKFVDNYPQHDDMTMLILKRI
jgi:hypothetical protein